MDVENWFVVLHGMIRKASLLRELIWNKSIPGKISSTLKTRGRKKNAGGVGWGNGKMGRDDVRHILDCYGVG